MKIAQIAPLFVRVPPERYGGTERVVHGLTEALVAAGHEVTLFAAGGSETSARLHATTPKPLWEMGVADPFAYRVLQVEEVVRRSAEFDLIHSHVEYLPWLAGERLRAPVLTTLHGRLDLPELRPLLSAMKAWPLVSMSNAQREPVADLDLRWIATIYNGLDLESTYNLGDGRGGYLAYLGRIAPERDPVTAIRIAIRVGIPLKMAARVDPTDQNYFDIMVRPQLEHPLIEWLGEIDDAGKNQLIGSARALLMPLNREEPFGLTFIESLACGTPVIASPRGSLNEIVRPGVDGFLCADDEAFARACHDVLALDRSACREGALERFTTGRMVADYERAYGAVTRGNVLVA
jgi:glycosyltransferase involved in cell wall biosynthesis